MEKITQSKRINYDKAGIAFILPYLITFLIFGITPIVYTIYMSFTDITAYSYGPVTLVGLNNYIQLLTQPVFYVSFLNTIILWVLSFIPNIVVSFLLALVFTDRRLKFKGVTFFRTTLYMPTLLMPAAVAVFFASIFGSGTTAGANQILISMGFNAIDFPRNEFLMRIITSFILFWMYFGMNLILIIAGLCGIDASYYEAAEIDGANRMQTFFKVTLPLMSSMVVYIAINSIIGGLQIFDIPYFMVDSTPDNVLTTVTMLLYNYGFGTSGDYSFAATIAVCQFVVIASLSMFVFRKNLKGNK